MVSHGTEKLEHIIVQSIRFQRVQELFNGKFIFPDNI